MTEEITIEWLEDEHDCEICGFSVAEGARVTVNGATAIELLPSANCCGGTTYAEWEVYHALLNHLGHDVPKPDWYTQ